MIPFPRCRLPGPSSEHRQRYSVRKMVAVIGPAALGRCKLRVLAICCVAVLSGISATPPVMKTLARGSMLRITADVTGGLPLDHWKTRSVRHPSEGVLESLCNVYLKQGGIKAFWSGLPAKVVDGALCGALLLAGKEATKNALTRVVMRARLPIGEAAIGAAAGVVGGVAQCAVLTPSTFLVMTAATTGQSVADTLAKIAKGERKATDLYTGGGGLVLREASNWASRQGITDFTRNALRGRGVPAGMALEIGSGICGGILACWNNPFEVARIRQQRDLALTAQSPARSSNKLRHRTKTVKALDGSTVTVPGPGASPFAVIHHVIKTEGVQGLFIGIVPRCVVSAHLTVFMVVAPRLLGV